MNKLEELVLRKEYRKQLYEKEFFQKLENKRSVTQNNKICRKCGRDSLEFLYGSYIHSANGYDTPSLATICKFCGSMDFYALVPSELEQVKHVKTQIKFHSEEQQ